ncbi:MAG: MGMT family protein [Verrucomicrobiae bacterium]|nr:MGMT family protein [Verrucomicrobiae bacterium]
MAAAGSEASERLRAEVLRLVALIPEGRFTTYGSIAFRLKVNPRRVAWFLARLSPEEAGVLPWHRVVAAEGRISRGMDPALRAEQQELLEAEGLEIDGKGFVLDPDRHFHAIRS